MPFLTSGADMARPSKTGGKTSEAKHRRANPAKAGASRAKGRSASDPSKDLKEAREQQAATAEILKIIASSPSDVQPVFEAIAERSNRLVEGLTAAVYSLVDDTLHLMAFTRNSPAADAAVKASYPRPLSA